MFFWTVFCVTDNDSRWFVTKSSCLTFDQPHQKMQARWWQTAILHLLCHASFAQDCQDHLHHPTCFGSVWWHSWCSSSKQLTRIVHTIHWLRLEIIKEVSWLFSYSFSETLFMNYIIWMSHYFVLICLLCTRYVYEMFNAIERFHLKRLNEFLRQSEVKHERYQM